MAVPSAPTVYIGGGHKPDVEAYAQIETLTSDAVTSVTVIVSQTQGGAAIETITSSSKSASYPRYEVWYVHYHTTGVTSSPYYITVYGTNASGDGTPTVVSTYIYFPPSVSITSPTDGATLTRSAVTMEWTATDPTGISYQRVSVSHDGTELWGVEVDGSSAAIPSSVIFDSGESYAFSVTARNGRGMETTATSTASFLFVTPTAAILGIAEGAGKSAVIEVTGYAERESSSQPDPDYVDVARVNPDGSSWLIATGLHVGDTVTDPLPPLGTEAVYKAIGRVVNAGVSEATYTTTIMTCCWALNFDASTVRMVGRNPSSSISYDHGGELYHFARGFQNPEDMLPEFYPVGAVDGKASLEFDAETREIAVEIMGLFFQHPTVWIRTPFGERMKAKASANLNLSRDSKRITVSYDLVRFGEAW